MSPRAVYVISEISGVWPGEVTKTRVRSLFKTQWLRTLQLVAREVGALGAVKFEIALSLPHGAGDINRNGQLTASARPEPPVLITFVDRDGVRHTYPCDRYTWWQDNLYAIGKAMENLRAIERWGVFSRLARAGFKALPGPGGSTVTMTAADAAGVLAKHSDTYTAAAILRSDTVAREAIKAARARTHPDVGGARADYDTVDSARQVIEAHHGAAA
jgi:hypothetical protein